MTKSLWPYELASDGSGAIVTYRADWPVSQQVAAQIQSEKEDGGPRQKPANSGNSRFMSGSEKEAAIAARKEQLDANLGAKAGGQKAVTAVAEAALAELLAAEAAGDEARLLRAVQAYAEAAGVGRGTNPAETGEEAKAARPSHHDLLFGRGLRESDEREWAAQTPEQVKASADRHRELMFPSSARRG